MGSDAPLSEAFLRARPEITWDHLPLGAIEKWVPDSNLRYEKVYVDLSAIPDVERKNLEAWKATLNALLVRLVHDDGRVPQLVGFYPAESWNFARTAVRIGVRDLCSLEELRSEWSNSASSQEPALGELLVLPIRPHVRTAPSSEPTHERVVPFPIEGLEGSSLAIETVRNVIRMSASSSASVLIIGPTGSGKERVAHALHRYSSRAAKPFQIVDCAAISPDLFESEFFGHVVGAFTNAVSDRRGALELADGGVLFIDQIHLLPLAQQAKLLRALQDKKFSPLGSDFVRSVDIRIIASSQQPLAELVHSGHFREDLYFRLGVIDIFLPALRERLGDISEIIESHLKKFAKAAHRPLLKLRPACLEKILFYEWPGNIRELGNCLERACTVVWAEGRTEIDVSDLPETLQFAVMKTMRTQGLRDAVRRFEQEHIAQTIRRFGGSKEEAAESLGLSLATLYRKLGT